MLVLIHATYPGNVAGTVLAAFTSSDIPQRPDAKELATFSYTGHDGIHGIFIFDVEDSKLAAWMTAQGERNIFMSSRVEGFSVEVQTGLSVPEGISVAAGLIPK